MAWVNAFPNIEILTKQRERAGKTGHKGQQKRNYDETEPRPLILLKISCLLKKKMPIFLLKILGVSDLKT